MRGSHCSNSAASSPREGTDFLRGLRVLERPEHGSNNKENRHLRINLKPRQPSNKETSTLQSVKVPFGSPNGTSQGVFVYQAEPKAMLSSGIGRHSSKALQVYIDNRKKYLEQTSRQGSPERRTVLKLKSGSSAVTREAATPQIFRAPEQAALCFDSLVNSAYSESCTLLQQSPHLKDKQPQTDFLVKLKAKLITGSWLETSSSKVNTQASAGNLPDANSFHLEGKVRKPRQEVNLEELASRIREARDSCQRSNSPQCISPFRRPGVTKKQAKPPRIKLPNRPGEVGSNEVLRVGTIKSQHPDSLVFISQRFGISRSSNSPQTDRPKESVPQPGLTNWRKCCSSNRELCIEYSQAEKSKSPQPRSNVWGADRTSSADPRTRKMVSNLRVLQSHLKQIATKDNTALGLHHK